MSRKLLRERLRNAWAALRGGGPASPPFSSGPTGSGGEDARLAAEAAAAGLRLELEEAKKLAVALRRELDAERGARADAVEVATASRLEPFLAEAAALLGQLALQERLLEKGKPIETRDVMALAEALSRILERQGLVALDAVGEMRDYDPACHQSLGGTALTPGLRVRVKMPGYSLKGKILRKAMVEPVGAC